MEVSEKQVKEVAIGLAAIAAGMLIKKVLEESYEAVYEKEPPNAKKETDVNWLHVLGWSVLTGASATALKIFVRRMALKYLD